MRLYNSRQVDELVVLDVAATNEGREPNFELIRDLAGDIYSPLAVGGGIRTIEHFRLALENGADKVVVNTAASENPGLIIEASRKFGAQSVVVSIDCEMNGALGKRVSTNSGKRLTQRDPVSWALKLQDYGAGEILLNSVDKDGTMTGYDLDLIRQVSAAVSIPVVACGGAGELSDFRLALEAGAHGVAASAIYCFTDTTPIDVSEYLHGAGYPVRRR